MQAAVIINLVDTYEIQSRLWPISINTYQMHQGKVYQIPLCHYQNLHKRQQLNLTLHAYYKIRFGMVT